MAIDQDRCIKCGVCREKCVFGAVTSDFKVDAIACEGCGVCTVVCPANAAALVERVSGCAYFSKTQHGFMAHAMLYPGEANSGKLVTLVRQNAKRLAEKKGSDLVLVDGSPGVGCPVIASIAGVDAGLVVTEPTLSGIHDLERVVGLLDYFRVTPLVCVNMFDVNRDNTDRILSFCGEHGVKVVGKIPFSREVTAAMVDGKTVVEYAPHSAVAAEITAMWVRIVDFLCEA